LYSSYKMNEYLEYLKNPFMGALVAALFIVFLAYMDKRTNEREFEGNYFFKLFVVVYCLVAGLLYFVGSDSKIRKQVGGGSSMTSSSAGSSNVVVNRSGLEIYADLPDF
jgi:hypothetical protein